MSRLARALLVFGGLCCTGGALAWTLAMGGAHAPWGADETKTGLLNRYGPPHVWKAVHVVMTGCPCSALVMKHLLERPLLPGVHEIVLLLGSDPERAEALRHRGFAVEISTPERTAADFGIYGAPRLVFLSPAGTVVYSGGYAAHPAVFVSDLDDVELWKRVSRGNSPEPNPVFGCPTSAEVRRRIDPLRSNYP